VCWSNLLVHNSPDQLRRAMQEFSYREAYVRIAHDSGNARSNPNLVEEPTRGSEEVALGDQVEHLRIPST
jgi:hypothetical protein